MAERQTGAATPFRAAEKADTGRKDQRAKVGSSMWQFWVDRGGTFTDIVARTPAGDLLTHKLLSENPEQYKDAAVAGIRHLLDLSADQDIPSNAIDAVKMGTTVATNALLERKGDRTLLLITEGFGDLLRIGYQNRPRLFDLHIQLPQSLYEASVEAPERLDADGKILTALDEASVRTHLQTAFNDGIRGVAIAFMHAYLNPVHEQRAAEIAREIGFTQISTSHETSRLIKLVGRGDTTVVDAYLSPVLRRYVNQVTDALTAGHESNARVQFMQSNGGLTDAALFQGKDAILSGPAGGVVGMVATAAKAGFNKLIGFDMGGTSTDVCHFAGTYERSFETQVAGVRMRAPMINIHTVAAGGGSILTFRDGRFQVGPESAGANPGPACYRRGGPLTVTDCNVMLGKLNPAHFPAVFGPDADQPLDAEIVAEKFQQLAQEIAVATDQPELSAEATADGFLQIAVENMANAIKKISVERGYDVTRYTLNCFGGAGGQHACLVADALGMESVFLHPFAGVLSAYGMGQADVRALREAQVEAPLSELEHAKSILDDLEREAKAELIDQRIAAHDMRVERRVHLRFDTAHQSLEVPVSDIAQMTSDFEAAHKQRFGFVPEGRQIIMEMASVEAIGTTYKPTDNRHDPSTHQPVPLTSISVFLNGRHRDVPLYDRDRLKPDQSITGPAVITEATGTTVIEPGWRGRIDPFLHLILERYQPLPRQTAIGTDVNPIMLEVFNNLFMSIADQMGATLANTAYSVNIKERLDFSCALFDEYGNLVANAPHVPVHLGSMSESVRTIARLNAGAMAPGDVFMLNAPFNGGTHLPDVTVITPVFDADGSTIRFYVGSRGHHADIGGKTPGSAPPDSTHIDEEGVVIDNFKLVDKGRLREAETRDLLASGQYPCRNIDQNMADLEAQIAANNTGVREVNRAIETFGLETVLAYMGHVQANAEESVRHVIGELKNSSYTFQIDNGNEIKVAISVDHQDRSAVIDFTGTSPQHTGNFNAPLAVCHAVTLYVFRTLVGKPIPMNEGCLAPLKIIAPDGSMINPKYPAAVISGNTEVSQSICNCLYGALGVLAGSQATMNNFVWGNERFQNYETIAGGTGAGPTFDGASGVQAHMTNTLMTDPEVLEKRFPVRLEQFRLRRGSGGGGRHSGGDGVVRTLTFLEDVTTTLLTSNRVKGAFGVDGGADGSPGINTLIRLDGTREAGGSLVQWHAKAGEAVEIQTPGGGGWGPEQS